ncbi:unnamed protein product [Prorocentrum cordatum]|uniref:Uncharacterized protein n=1 Tax=Prorocentrum cordatum TaxID=2364126 RepID=A0ABN9UB51_9DINO|nr:unnamed protein product [Polarella glacialis]
MGRARRLRQHRRWFSAPRQQPQEIAAVFGQLWSEEFATLWPTGAVNVFANPCAPRFVGDVEALLRATEAEDLRGALRTADGELSVVALFSGDDVREQHLAVHPGALSVQARLSGVVRHGGGAPRQLPGQAGFAAGRARAIEAQKLRDLDSENPKVNEAPLLAMCPASVLVFLIALGPSQQLETRVRKQERWAEAAAKSENLSMSEPAALGRQRRAAAPHAAPPPSPRRGLTDCTRRKLVLPGDLLRRLLRERRLPLEDLLGAEGLDGCGRWAEEGGVDHRAGRRTHGARMIKGPGVPRTSGIEAPGAVAGRREGRPPQTRCRGAGAAALPPAMTPGPPAPTLRPPWIHCWLQIPGRTQLRSFRAAGRRKQYIAEHIPELIQIQVVLSFKYLDMVIGCSAHECHWRKPVAKFAPQVREVRQLGFSLAKNIPTFNILCLSILSFVMQFAPFSRDVCAAYENVLQLLAVDPRLSFNYEMLTNLASLGFPGKFKHVEAVSLAAKFWLVSRCSEILGTLEDLGAPPPRAAEEAEGVAGESAAGAAAAVGLAGSAQLPASAAAQSSPVTRIVELLKGLKEQCELDAKTDEILYEKFVCWGREVLKQKKATNALATKEVAELTQYIADLDAGRIELTTEREDLVKERPPAHLPPPPHLGRGEGRLRERRSGDDPGHRGALQGRRGPEDCHRGRQARLGAWDWHGPARCWRTGRRAEETAMLNHAVELGDRFLGKGDALFLRRLLTGEVPTWDWKKLNRKATFKMSYKARSSEIQDVIAKLLQTFETNKADAIEKEEKAVAAHDALMESLNSERGLTQEALTKMEKENGAKSLSRTEAQGRIDFLNEQIANDEKYISQVTTELAEKKAEWEERSRVRYGEIGAISKAIEILHNDGARDLFKKSLSSQGYFFLQTGQHSTMHDASDALRSLARRTSDPRILGLVTQMQLAPAFGSLADRFTPIIEKIDSLVTMIGEEEASDLAKKESCEQTRASNTREAIKLSRAIDEDSDTMSRLTSEIEQLDQQITENNEAIEVLETQMTSAGEQRAAENKAYLSDKADDEGAASTVQAAYDVLETFYREEGLMLVQKKSRAPVVVAAGKAPPPPPTTWDSPYAGKTAESTGVLAILSMIKEDIERDISNADAAEAKALASYTKLMEDLNKEKGMRVEENAAMETQKAGKQGEHTQTEGARATKKTGLDSVLAGIAGLEPSCNYFTINFPVRVKNRQIEVDGLLKAKAILTGADFDPKKEQAAAEWKDVPVILRPKEFQLRQLKAATVSRHP